MKLIFISGPSGSGKTTLSKNILVEQKNGYILSTDNYYRTGLVSEILSKIIDGYFDRGISLNYKLLKNDFLFIIRNGISNNMRLYDFKKKEIKKYSIKTENIKFLIVEGIFARDLECCFPNNDCFLIELRINKNYCMNRVIKRDIEERGKLRAIAKKDFLKSWEIYFDRLKDKKSHKIANKFVFKKNTDLKKILKKIF